MGVETAVVLSVVTGICTLGAMVFVIWWLWQIVRWPRVQAQIVRYRITRSNGNHGQRFYHPVYRFRTIEGRPLVGLSMWGSWRRPWPRGSLVWIRYHPDNPRRTAIQCFATSWGVVLTLVGLTAFAWFVMLWLPWYFNVPTPW